MRWRVKCEKAERGSARPTAEQIAKSAKSLATPNSQLTSPTGALFASGGMTPTPIPLMVQGALSNPLLSPVLATNSVAWNQYLLASQATNLGLYSPSMSHSAFMLPMQFSSPTLGIFSPSTYVNSIQDSPFATISKRSSDSPNDSPDFDQQFSPSGSPKKRRMSSDVLSTTALKRSN